MRVGIIVWPVDGWPVDEAALTAFFQYAQRRSRVMMLLGFVAILAGVTVALAAGGGAGAVTAILVIVGVSLIIGSAAGLRSLGACRRVAAGPAQAVELRSWPHRGIRATSNNRVLVTLDRPGSVNRTPLAEFKATWFTPGAAESGVRSARVHGPLTKGEVVLAVADDGSCFAGRVSRIRE